MKNILLQEVSPAGEEHLFWAMVRTTSSYACLYARTSSVTYFVNAYTASRLHADHYSSDLLVVWSGTFSAFNSTDANRREPWI